MAVDPYAWMEDLSSRELTEWIEEENRRFSSLVRGLSEKLFKRIKKYFSIPNVLLLRVSKSSYFTLVRDERSYSIWLHERRKRWVRKKLVNSLELGKDAVITTFYVSHDGSRLAYYYTIAGSDEGVMKVVNIYTGEVVDELRGSVGDVVWLDGERYYYSRFYRRGKAPDGIPAPTERVFLREGSRDYLVFGEGLPTGYHLTLTSEPTARKVLITVMRGWSESDVYGGELKDPRSWELVHKGGGYLAKPVGFLNGSYIIAKYDDPSGLGRVISVSSEFGEEELIRPLKYPLRDAVIFNERIFCHYLVNASSTLRVHNKFGVLIKEITFEPPGTISNLVASEEMLLFKFESFNTPYRIYKVRKYVKVIEEVKIPVEVRVSDLWVNSWDGTPVHAFVASRKSVKPDKVLVYGYGGFNIAVTPRYFPYLLPFIEDGGTLVLVNARGGGEFGEKWHREGMREKKVNTFEDFKAVVRYFKKMGARVVAIGKSNGGLTVGAVLTSEPELLDGAVIGYPVLDLLKFHKLYIGRLWVSEYGNPDDPKDREFLKKYSPYHNIRPGVKYPPTLLTTGLHDDRVHPTHAFKFARKLRDAGGEVYLRTEVKSGHSGATPDVTIRELADVMAFTYLVLGLTPGSKNDWRGGQ